MAGKAEWFPDFYTPRFMAGGSWLSLFLIFLTGIIFRSRDPRKREATESFQLAIAVALALNGIGALGLFKLYLFGFEYDKFVHFLVAFVLCISVADFLSVWYGWKRKKSFTAAAVLVLGGGLIWEPIELLTDIVFGTQTLGLYGNDIARDTLMDIFFNFLGALLAFPVFLLGGKNNQKHYP